MTTVSLSPAIDAVILIAVYPMDSDRKYKYVVIFYTEPIHVQALSYNKQGNTLFRESSGINSVQKNNILSDNVR